MSSRSCSCPHPTCESPLEGCASFSQAPETYNPGPPQTPGGQYQGHSTWRAPVLLTCAEEEPVVRRGLPLAPVLGRPFPRSSIQEPKTRGGCPPTCGVSLQGPLFLTKQLACRRGNSKGFKSSIFTGFARGVAGVSAPTCWWKQSSHSGLFR